MFYSEEHVIYGEYAYEVWDDKLIEHILSFFTPENMRIDLTSKSFDTQSHGKGSHPVTIKNFISSKFLKLRIICRE